ncbi:MAG: 50S ribosomal protein L11 methyltransferase [Oscillospiraceae bacterium]
MDWTQMTIYTATAGIDAVTGSLLCIGIAGFEITDSADFAEFLEGKNGQWDYIDESLFGLGETETTVKIYLPNNAQGADLLAAVKAELEALKRRDTGNAFGKLTFDLGSIREEDWANNWKQYFKPIEIGERLVVKPSWEELDPQGRVVLEIDPASSFGTGQHNTTRLCLELIERVMKPGDRVLDLGCGSGILSIGAMLLGAVQATAADIDENSVRIAAENARKNSISDAQYKTLCGDIISDEALRAEIGGGFDLICANIVSDVLIAMSGLFGAFLKPTGRLIVSGIITERADEVLGVLVQAGFRLIETAQSEGWCAALLEVSAN